MSKKRVHEKPVKPIKPDPKNPKNPLNPPGMGFFKVGRVFCIPVHIRHTKEAHIGGDLEFVIVQASVGA